MISGINNWLTEPDALDRSIIVELDRPPDDLRKEETVVEANFEELRPKLFGYILDMLVKASQQQEIRGVIDSTPQRNSL